MQRTALRAAADVPVLRAGHRGASEARGAALRSRPMRGPCRARRGAAFAAALALAACVEWGAFAPALPPAPAMDPARISSDVRWLADDAREGRGAGTRGLEDAAERIAAWFREAGLAPAGRDGSWFQGFELPVGSDVAAQSLRAGGVELTADSDFAALLSSGSGSVRGPLAFAGYGISAPEQGYDDWAQVDVSGAVVLVLDDRPPGADALFSGVHGNALLGRAQKVANARDRGALAVLLAPSAGEGDAAAPLDLRDPSLGPSQRSGALPVLSLARAAAERLVAQAGGASLAELQRAIDGARQPASERLAGTAIELEVRIERRTSRARNVIGILEGADPVLRREALVIGAHYDHLGRGEFGSLTPARRGEVHNGADDNASGTAGVVELARAFAAGPRPRRSLVFAAFAGEEIGLFGSRAYVEDPPVPLADTVAMLNLDMVGRLREGRLVVFGTGSSRAFPPLLRRALRGLPLEASFSEDGFAPSDQTSFYARGVPVLMFFTGAHPQYHTPDDDAELVNAEGEALVLAAAWRVATALLDADGRPAGVAAKAPAPSGSGGGYGPWLGTVPAFGGPEGPGVLLQGVVPGSPAEAAGIRAGDRIVRFDGASVANLEELAARLYSARPGQVVANEVLRDGERIALEAR